LGAKPLAAISAAVLVCGCSPNYPEASSSTHETMFACPVGLIGIYQFPNGTQEKRRFLGGESGNCLMTVSLSDNKDIIVRPYETRPHLNISSKEVSSAINEVITTKGAVSFTSHNTRSPANYRETVKFERAVVYILDGEPHEAVLLHSTGSTITGSPIANVDFTFITPTVKWPWLIYAEASNYVGFVSGGAERLVDVVPDLSQPPSTAVKSGPG
jgi:hypothetical protein